VEDGGAKLLAASDVAVVDRNTPFVQWVESVVKRMAADADAGKPRTFSLPAYCSAETRNSTPIHSGLWAPLTQRDGTVFAGLLQARETVWRDGDVAPAMRLAGAYQHAWRALEGADAGRPFRWRRRWLLLAAAGAVILAGFIPVPLTALAPVEVVAKNPLVVTAPFDGVVDTIVAEPNAPVKQGEEVFRFVDTVLRNKYQAAEQSVEVASARFRRFQQAAMEDSKARHEMAIARAELGLALSERDYAREVLGKAIVTAPADGIVILASKDYWKGRPVSTGEQILQIARPGDVELRIDLAVSDAIVLREGADVNVYLDAAPLARITARLTHASYQAEPSETQTLAYRVRAT
jgi:multidrug resistance efflux pump